LPERIEVNTPTLRTTAPTLDEYRAQVLERFKTCTDPAQVCDLLAGVEIVLATADMSRTAQAAFWQNFGTELDVLVQHSKLVLEGDAGKNLRALVAAARTAIARYQRKLADGEPPLEGENVG
jgi:hypothetical protein